MKFKRQIALLLILLMVLTSTSFGVNKKIPTFNDKTNNYEWITDSPKAEPGINYFYQTLGFQAIIEAKDGFKADIYFIPSDRKEFEELQDNQLWIRTEWKNLFSDTSEKRVGDPTTWSTTGIYEEFIKKYRYSPDYKEKITAFFENGGKLKLNAILTKKIGSRVLGSITVKNGYIDKKVEPVFFNYDQFNGCGWTWSERTQEAVKNNFYNIELPFSPQPVTKPTAKIQRSSTTKIDSGYVQNGNMYYKESTEHRFKEGEPITLGGEGSTFGPNSTEKQYVWTYRNVDNGATDTKAVVEADSPFNNEQKGFAKSLPVGTYEVTLSTKARYKVPWKTQYEELLSDKEARTKVIVEKNDDITKNPAVIVEVQSPESVKYEPNENSKKIKAKLKVTIQNNVIDTNLIKGVYMKLSDQTTKFVQAVRLPTPSLQDEMEYEFDVLYQEARHHKFEGFAQVVLKNDISIDAKIAYSTTYIYKEIPPPPIDKPTPPEKPNAPPIPILDMQEETTLGSDVHISGSRSYDTDGTVEQYYIYIPQLGFSQSSEDIGTIGKKTAFYNFRAVGAFNVILGVRDNKGAYSETSQQIKVTPPKPSVDIRVSGTLKENRKVTFTATNGSEFISPVGQNYSWGIVPLNNEADPSEDNGINVVSWRGKSIDVLFKNSGKFRVTAEGTNSYGMKGTCEIIVNVSVDAPPVPQLNAPPTVYRNDNKTVTVEAFDNSFSTDGDFIHYRTWFYRYDANNNGTFDDEGFTLLKDTADYTDNSVKLTVGAVGKYQLRVVSRETFGQETIPQFITPADYKSCEAVKTVEVDNISPNASFNTINDKKIDIAIMTDYEGQQLLDVEARLNEFKRDANNVYQNVNFSVISDKKYVGRYLNKDASGYANVQNVFAPKYQVANWNGLIEYSDNSYAVTVSTTRRYTNETVTTNDVFPSRVKQSVVYNNNEAKLWLLENGDLYFAGTNSANNAGFWGGCAYAMKPTKVLTGVKQIEGGDNKYYLLQTNGEIYAIGHSFNAFYGTGMFFVKIFNQLNWSSVVGYGTDNTGNAPYAYGTYNTSTGDTGIAKVSGVSNIDYMWSNGNALVAKRTDGKWFGFGSGLNAFGLSTGFKNKPRESLGNYTGGTDVVSILQMQETWYHLDNQNSFVELTNLSNLNSLCGGIKKVEPNKAYARNGNVYTFQETPTTQWDSQFRITNSVFAYQGAGTWTDSPKERKTDSMVIPVNTIKTYGVDRTPYVSWIKEPLTGQTFKVSTVSQTAAAIPDSSAIAWIGVESTLFEYVYVAYTKSYAYMGTAPDPNFVDTESEGKPRKGYCHTYKVSVGPKVLLGESSSQAGFKTFALDTSKVTQMSLRAGSERYLVYLGLNDSFKNVNKSFGDYLKNNKIKSRISTKTEFLDQAVEPSTQINLRQTLNTVPNGKFYGENGLESILNDIMSENEKKVDSDGSIFVVVNEDSVELTKNYYDNEGDPKYSDSLTASHDPNHFENSQGLSAHHGRAINTNAVTFDKAGKYTLKYKATDNPSADNRFNNYRRDSEEATLTVVAHRRPFAVPNLILTKGNNASQMILKCKDGGSTDYDHQSEINGGITDVEWSFKPKTDQAGVTWQNLNGAIGTTMTQTLAYGETYLVTYRVKDKENAWSDPVSQEIQAVPQLFMDAELKPQNPAHSLKKFSTGNSVTFHSVWTSYQLPHAMYAQLYDGNRPVLSPMPITYHPNNYWATAGIDYNWHDIQFLIPKNAGLQDKTYRLQLRAFDLGNTANYKFKDFYVTLVNNTAPTIKVVKMLPSTLLEADDLLLTVLPEDRDNDRLTLTVSGSFLKTANGNNVQKENLTPFNLSNLVSGNTINLSNYKNLKAGQYELLFEVMDPHGAKGTTQIAFTVGEFSIEDIQVTGSWNHWRGQKDLFGEQLENHKGRFLSYEAVRIDVKTLGNPERVDVRMSPELENMVFKSSSGKLYAYKDALGYDVKFPIELNAKKAVYTAEYILPLAPSTLTEKGIRLRQSYWIDVNIYKLGRVKTKRYGGNNALEGIEITGNVYDHVYQQPVKKRR